MSKNAEDIWTRFRYYAPTSETRNQQHADARQLVCELALALDEVVPDGREKALVLTKLEEALFWANAAIARS